MNKKDVLEIKRRFKKEQATFSRIAGCYVDGNKNKVCTFNEPFLNQEDDVFFKYLEIANKALSGTLNNNLLNLEFPLSEEVPGGRQQFLMGIRECGLTSDALMDSWYDMVISQIEITGNYLILVFADAYDVPMKTKDDLKLGESEEIYKYILCAVCPVILSKPGLSFLEKENRIGARIRDWVVGVPEAGFLFPAFSERTTDIHSVLFYTKDPKNPHTDMIENVLGCGSVMTNAEKKNAFHTIVREVLGPDDEDTEDKLLAIQKSISDMNEEYEEAYEDTAVQPMALTHETLSRALSESKILQEKADRIVDFVDRTFGEMLPEASAVVDLHALKSGGLKLENKELMHELAEKTLEAEHLKKELDEEKKLSVAPSLKKCLRPFKAVDAERILSWVNDERTFQYWSVGRYPAFPAQPEDMVDLYRRSENGSDNFYPMTAFDEQGIFGHLILRYMDEERKHVRLGYIVVDDKRRGQGLGKILLKLSVRYAKQFLGAEKITLGVVDRNLSAAKCYEAAGFREDPSQPIETVEMLGENWNIIGMRYEG